MVTEPVILTLFFVTVADIVVAIISPESAPAKRMIQECKERAQLIDATHGRKTRAVIIADSGHIILSAVQPETVAGRLTGGKDDEIEENEIED